MNGQTAVETEDLNSRRAVGDRGCSHVMQACFHCGEACPDGSLTRDQQVFCCQGCATVHDILAASGLARFYELTPHPGVRLRRDAISDQWAFLDAPAVQQRLLDFTDGKKGRVTFHIPAIHCIACVWLLENLFRLHPGIGRSRVNYPKREVVIMFAADRIKLSELVARLASIGYEPALTLGELEKSMPVSTRRRQWLQVGIAGFAFGNIMLLSLPQYFGLDSLSGTYLQSVFGWLSLLLALPVLLFSAADYWISAWFSLRQRRVTLDVPIALGLAAIYGQSALEIISRSGEGYCDSLSGLIFFLLCGRVFQQKVHGRLAFDRDYKSFFPLSVTRKNTGGERVALSQLQMGDRVVIRHGELIPADSRLVGGSALIDYSFVTGESEPVDKQAGDYLYAGGQQTGPAIELELVKPVSQSYLASLWNHEAFQKNPDDTFNTLTNHYSRLFTVIVIFVAVAAAAFWVAAGDFPRGLKAFTSVLIVACPCALALSVPFTMGTAQRWLARIKVFFKNTLVIERLAQVDAIVFDKTGTLTSAVAKEVGFEGNPLTSAEEAGIFSLSRHSTHPHAVRICESFGATIFPEPVASFRETPGGGIEGWVQGHEIRLGSRAWLEACGIQPLENGSPAASGSMVHVAIDRRHRGAFVLTSGLRPETDRLVRRLAQRCELALLSGDNERERERFRELFGGEARLLFNQSPLDKLGFVRRLQDSGRTVMMVGDGLNDAGALRQSDVGVAVVEKIGAFSPASDVILDAARVPQLFEILVFARRAARIVRISFAISAGYNIVGVGIAAAGWLSPLVSAVLMPLSSVSVVLFACGVTTWAAHRAGLLEKQP